MEKLAAMNLARSILREHGLSDWTFAFDRATKRFGCCRHSRRTITLSLPLTLLNDEAEVRETILHEAAHALAGPGKGHGPEWRAVARRIGSNARRTHNAETPEGRYQAVCKGCGRTVHRDRKTLNMGETACGPCCKRYNGGRYSEDYRLEFRDTRTGILV